MKTEVYNNFVEKMNFVPQTREYLGLALGGECGEVLNEMKKEMRPGAEPRHEKVAYELGDTLYYLTATAKFYGYSLEQIMEMNISKLEARKAATGVPA